MAIKPKKRPMKGFGFRADENQMAKARLLKLDVNEIVRKSLDQAIMKASQVCPTCKRSIKK